MTPKPKTTTTPRLNYNPKQREINICLNCTALVSQCRGSFDRKGCPQYRKGKAKQETPA